MEHETAASVAAEVLADFNLAELSGSAFALAISTFVLSVETRLVERDPDDLLEDSVTLRSSLLLLQMAAERLDPETRTLMDMMRSVRTLQ